ncbi:MAG: BrxA family protein [Cyanobacteria bacterium J06627_28]
MMASKTTTSDVGSTDTGRKGYGTEVDKFHTRLLRVSLALEESREYWEQMTLTTPKEGRAKLAFENRWFGSKSMARVQRLLAEFGHRYDAYPEAIAALIHWQPNDLTTRQNICHWHLQLSDPMYRAFSSTFLEERRSQKAAKIDRDIVARWVTQNITAEWASATVLRMATALITCATAAGLCERAGSYRTLTYPKVTDAALTYWVYFLRGLQYQGTLLKNSYFMSVGLSDRFLEQRLRQLDALTFSRMGDLHEFDWRYADLQSWAASLPTSEL